MAINYPTEPLQQVNARYYLKNRESSPTRGTRTQVRIRGGTEDFGANLEGPASTLLTSLKADVSEQRNTFSYFILQDISINQQEKTHIFDLYGDNYVVYYLGRCPTTINLSGITIDDIENNWWYRFMIGYEQFLRGTALAEHKTLVEITTCNMQVIGTITSLSTRQSAERDTDVQFNMQMLVKTIRYDAIEGANDVGSIRNTLSNTFANTGFIPSLAQQPINSIKASSPADATAYTARGADTGNNNGASLTDYQQGDSGYALNAALGSNEQLSFYSLNPVYTSAYDNNQYRSAAEVRQSINAIPGYAQDVIRGIRSIRSMLFSVASIPLGFLSRINNEINFVLRGPREILREIQGLGLGLQGIVGQLYSEVTEPFYAVNALRSQFDSTVNTIKNTAGTIAFIPRTLSEEIKYLTSSNALSSPGAFISGVNGGSNASDIRATLSGISRRTADKAATL